jgi:hypothetical protein
LERLATEPYTRLRFCSPQHTNSALMVKSKTVVAVADLGLTSRRIQCLLTAAVGAAKLRSAKRQSAFPMKARIDARFAIQLPANLPSSDLGAAIEL